jgi:UDP:flavonoid glycosyltransferase YjiC (YdhE family)
LASILHEDGVADVELACDPRYFKFVGDAGFPVRSIRSLSSEAFLDVLARGGPVFSKSDLQEYVAEDLALLEARRPDIVVGDFRLSLSVSARLAGIPYVNVTNAYWSPYARPRFRMPSLAATRVIPPAVADVVFPLVRPFAFALHARPMNQLRRDCGLPLLGRDVRQLYCDGDMTLYADIPELIPTMAAPATHRYIGPVLWSPPVDLPVWWDDAIGRERPIYVSLGSSGRADLLPMVVQGLIPLGRPIVVATAGRGNAVPKLPNVWIADFVPGGTIAAKACLVVCNGGSPTTQQALVHGTPVIGIASNLDQFLNMDYIERFGAGTLLRADSVTAHALRDVARAIIDSQRVRKQAEAAASLLTAVRPEAQFPTAIRNLSDAVPAVAKPASER